MKAEIHEFPVKGTPMPLHDFNAPEIVVLAQGIMEDMEHLRKLALKDLQPLREMRITNADGYTCGYAHWSAKIKRILESIDSGVNSRR